jgi:hypothetical protein
LTELDLIAENDPTVHSIVLLAPSGRLEPKAALLAGVVILAKQKAKLLQEIAFLQQIAPRRYRVDGKELVWHTPDWLIPITQLDQ